MARPDIVSIAGTWPVAISLNDKVVAPTAAPANLSVEATDIDATIWITKGNGNGRIIMIHKDPGTNGTPEDESVYVPIADFGHGSKLGDAYVVMSSNDAVVNVTGLQPETNYVVTTYEFNVNVKNTIIDYLPTAIQTSFITRKSQTITFNDITPKALGNGTYTIVATASSGLPTTLMLRSGEGALVGNEFQPAAAGKVTIKASQEGSLEYGPAEDSVTFCVNPSKPTISLSNDPIPTLTSSSDDHNNWYHGNDVISGATEKTYKPTEDGTYKVTVDVDGCTNTSDPTSSIIAGLEDDVTKLFSISPNPASSIVRIGIPKDFKGDPIFLNTVGQQISLPFTKHENAFEVNTADLASGIYIIRFAGASLKLLKQ